MGSGGVSVLGEGAAASRRKPPFPSHALGELWVLAPGLHPAPPGALGKASRHTQAHAGPGAAPRGERHPRPIAMATPGFVPFPTPPVPRLLPERQPTGLCASQERAIKPAQWRWPGRARAGAGRAEPISDLEEARESDPGKPEHAGCAEPESRSAQAVPLPGFPAPPSPGTGEWRTRQVPLVTV